MKFYHPPCRLPQYLASKIALLHVIPFDHFLVRTSYFHLRARRGRSTHSPPCTDIASLWKKGCDSSTIVSKKQFPLSALGNMIWWIKKKGHNPSSEYGDTAHAVHQSRLLWSRCSDGMLVGQLVVAVEVEGVAARGHVAFRGLRKARACVADRQAVEVPPSEDAPGEGAVLARDRPARKSGLERGAKRRGAR